MLNPDLYFLSCGYRGHCPRLDGFFERKEEREHSTAARSTLDMDRPMMTVDNLRNDGESQSDTCFLRGHKRVEDFFPQFVGNAGASVGQAKFHSFAIILCEGLNLDAQRAAMVCILILHGFVCVLHKIEESGRRDAVRHEEDERSPGIR